jgi:[NiFe] hydrogenase diaphorase moiety large subunit
MKKNRCGLGQTALNPIVSTIKNFPDLYNKRIKAGDERACPAFDLEKAVADFDAATAEVR